MNVSSTKSLNKKLWNLGFLLDEKRHVIMQSYFLIHSPHDVCLEIHMNKCISMSLALIFEKMAFMNVIKCRNRHFAA